MEFPKRLETESQIADYVMKVDELVSENGSQLTTQLWEIRRKFWMSLLTRDGSGNA